MDGCKKKLDAELETNFPEFFDQDVEHIERIREYEELRLRKYFGEDVDKTLMLINEYFIGLMTPKVFNPYNENCVLVENDRRNENLINAIEENGLSVKEATVFEFYSKIRYLEKRAQKMKERRK